MLAEDDEVPVKQNIPKQTQQRQQQQQAPQIPQKQPQQQQQQQPQNTVKPAGSIVTSELKYTKPNEFRSFYLIKSEIEDIKTGCMKQPIVAENAKLMEFYQKLVEALNKQTNVMLEFIEQGKLGNQAYGKFITESIKMQQAHLQEAQSQGEAFYQKRIQKRLNVLQQELNQYKSNPAQAFIQIIKMIKPNFVIPNPEQNKQPQQQQQPQQKKIKDENQLNKFKSNMNADQMVQINIDEQPKHVKYENLLIRYKQYVNFITYLSQYQKERKDDLDKLFQMMEKGKKLREDFTKGLNPNIGNFMINEMKEISFNIFHGMSQQEYRKNLDEMFRQFNEAMTKEREFNRLTLHSKSVVKGPKTISPFELSKQRIAQYEESLVFIKSLQQQQWMITPTVAQEDVSVQLCIENKDIPPNILRLKFIKLNNCKFEKYYLTYVVEAASKIVSNQTPICDQACVFNYSIDLPYTGEIVNKIVEVRLFEKGFFSNSEIAIGSFNFETLQQKAKYEGSVVFKNKKGGEISLSYSIELREPLDKYTNLVIKQLIHSKKFPPFDMQEGIKDFLDKFMQQLPSYEEYQKQQALKQQQEQLEQQQQQQQQQELQRRMEEEQSRSAEQQAAQPPSNLISLMHMETSDEIIKIKAFIQSNPKLPPGLIIDDLLYPENPMKFCVINHIQQYVDFIRDKSVEYRQDPSLRPQFKFTQNMWEEFLKQNNIITKKLDNGQVQWYLSKIQILPPLEDYLIQIYTQLNLPQWAEYVKARKDVLMQEITELSQMEVE